MMNMGFRVRVGEGLAAAKETVFRGRAGTGAVVAEFDGGGAIGDGVGGVFAGARNERVLGFAVDDVVSGGELDGIEGCPPEVEEGVAFNAESAACARGRSFAAEGDKRFLHLVACFEAGVGDG